MRYISLLIKLCQFVSICVACIFVVRGCTLSRVQYFSARALISTPWMVVVIAVKGEQTKSGRLHNRYLHTRTHEIDSHNLPCPT